MQSLEPSDARCLIAATGWLELGVPAEAEVELGGIPAERQSHPDVLEVRWMILARAQRWEAALEIARRLLQHAPDRSSGWLHQAYALRRVPNGGLQQAWDALLPAHDLFPQEPTIPYNLACYACQMSRLDEARDWLQRALKLGGKEAIKPMALNDPDLQPLWEEIRNL